MLLYLHVSGWLQPWSTWLTDSSGNSRVEDLNTDANSTTCCICAPPHHGNACQYSSKLYTPSVALVATMTSLGCVLCVVAVAFAVFTIVYRSHPVIRFSSKLFCLIMLLSTCCCGQSWPHRSCQPLLTTSPLRGVAPPHGEPMTDTSTTLHDVCYILCHSLLCRLLAEPRVAIVPHGRVVWRLGVGAVFRLRGGVRLPRGQDMAHSTTTGQPRAQETHHSQ